MLQDLPYNPTSDGIGLKTQWENPNPPVSTQKGFEDGLMANRPESKPFLATALTWHGSVSPTVLPRVLVTALYSTLVMGIGHYFPECSLPIAPFEYSGAVLGLLLVLRVNAGHDRWWEARKIWGTIVNQSRNLSLVVYAYGGENQRFCTTLLKWIAAWPHVMRETLRNEHSLREVSQLLDSRDVDAIRQAQHKPMYVGFRIAQMLGELRSRGLDSFAFLRAESERSQLIDAIGACERILNTRMPLVLAIKTRRFILLFLLLLPLALIERAGWLTPLYVALISYPLFSLDEIGAELQNPFSPRNLSHLPLFRICANIEANIRGLLKSDQSVRQP